MSRPRQPLSSSTATVTVRGNPDNVAGEEENKEEDTQRDGDRGLGLAEKRTTAGIARFVGPVVAGNGTGSVMKNPVIITARVRADAARAGTTPGSSVGRASGRVHGDAVLEVDIDAGAAVRIDIVGVAVIAFARLGHLDCVLVARWRLLVGLA